MLGYTKYDDGCDIIMSTVWKFAIPILDEFEIAMPRDAEPLFVGTQNDEPQLWARVVPERASEPRKFKLRGTGHPVDMDCEYIGSFMLHGGTLVFHLFHAYPVAKRMKAQNDQILTQRATEAWNHIEHLLEPDKHNLFDPEPRDRG